jgi:hypothetical protein
LASGGKGGLHRVANGLEVDAAMSRYRGIKQGKVTVDRSRHCLAVSLPALGTPLDVGEEKGDGARWEIGHSHPQIVLSPVTTVRTPSQLSATAGPGGEPIGQELVIAIGSGRPGTIR